VESDQSVDSLTVPACGGRAQARDNSPGHAMTGVSGASVLSLAPRSSLMRGLHFRSAPFVNVRVGHLTIPILLPHSDFDVGAA
jgi:hypothetical protein